MAPPPMPLLEISSPSTVSKCAAFETLPSDIFICSYPKSGTTWLQHVVLSLLLADRRHSPDPPPPYSHVSDYAPFYEIDAHWEPGDAPVLLPAIRAAHRRLGRRVFNTHLRGEMLPRGGACRRIYVVRAGPDVVVSFWHHLAHQNEGTYGGTLPRFVAELAEGALPYGKWTDHVLSYATARGPPTLFLAYEEMARDLPAAVRRIVRFLDLRVSDREVEELLPAFSFEAMARELDKFQPRSVTWKNNFRFLRRGVVGDGVRRMRETPGDGDGEPRGDPKATLLDVFENWCRSERLAERLGEAVNAGDDGAPENMEEALAAARLWRR